MRIDVDEQLVRAVSAEDDPEVVVRQALELAARMENFEEVAHTEP